MYARFFSSFILFLFFLPQFLLSDAVFISLSVSLCLCLSVQIFDSLFLSPSLFFSISFYHFIQRSIYLCFQTRATQSVNLSVEIPIESMFYKFILAVTGVMPVSTDKRNINKYILVYLKVLPLSFQLLIARLQGKKGIM